MAQEIDNTTNENDASEDTKSLMSRDDVAKFLDVNIQQLKTMIENGEIKPHYLNLGKRSYAFFDRAHVEAKKAELTTLAAARRKEYGANAAVYNLSKKTAATTDEILEQLRKSSSNTNRTEDALRAIGVQLADLRNRQDSVRSLVQQIQLELAKLNAALGNK